MSRSNLWQFLSFVKKVSNIFAPDHDGDLLNELSIAADVVAIWYTYERDLYRAKGARDLTHFSPFIFLINSLIHSLI